MRKWRGRLNSNNSAGLNNGHAETDFTSAPLKGAMNGDGSQLTPTSNVVAITSNNGRTLTPIYNGPCNNHNDKTIFANSDSKDNLKVPPYPSDFDGVVDVMREEDTDLCGIGAFKPQWIQPWANKNVFLAVFCLTSVLQGMYYTYFVSVLTTIEKLFQIQSKTTGIIMSATEMGQIGGALLLTYYGGQGHRPKWIACGMIVFAVASFLCSLPHFIFGVELAQNVLINGAMNNSEINKMHLCNDRIGGGAIKSGLDYGDQSLMSLIPKLPANFSGVADYARFDNMTVSPTSFFLENQFDGVSMFSGNSSAMMMGTKKERMCENMDSTNHTKITKIVLTIFFISLLFIGIGATAVYTLGIPYIDDNVANRDSPLYFGSYINHFSV